MFKHDINIIILSYILLSNIILFSFSYLVFLFLLFFKITYNLKLHTRYAISEWVDDKYNSLNCVIF